MSLKTVHLMFVFALSALCTWTGITQARDYNQTGAPDSLWIAVASFAALVAVIWYGTKVFRKLKGISYL